MSVHDLNAKQDAALVADLRAAGSTIEPPRSLDSVAMATRAVRSVRRRRTVLAVVGGVAGVVVATASGFALTYDATSGQAVLPGSGDVSGAPRPVASAEPTIVRTGPQPAEVPAGWQAAEFRGLAYALPGDWSVRPMDEDATDWSGPGQEIQLEGDPGGEAVAGSMADSMSMRADLNEPVGWGRSGETLREELDVPGAESATLVMGADPESQIDWADLVIHHDGGLWYTAHLDFVTDGARPDQVTRGFAESLAFTSTASEVRDGIEGLQGSDDLPVVGVDRETPSDWVVHELDGMRYALPPGMSADTSLESAGLDDTQGWSVPDGVQDGVDVYIAAIRSYDGYGATMAPPEDARAFEIPGAGRVQVTLREAEPWYNGATPLDVQFRVWDEQMAGTWDITATLPDTPEGEQTALRILGSVRLR